MLMSWRDYLTERLYLNMMILANLYVGVKSIFNNLKSYEITVLSVLCIVRN